MESASRSHNLPGKFGSTIQQASHAITPAAEPIEYMREGTLSQKSIEILTCSDITDCRAMHGNQINKVQNFNTYVQYHVRLHIINSFLICFRIPGEIK